MTTLYERISNLLLGQTDEPSKIEVINAVKEFYIEKKKTTKEESVKVCIGDNNCKSKKRKPTQYNVFITEQMAILKESEIDKDKKDCMTSKAKMQYVAALWKSNKCDSE